MTVLFEIIEELSFGKLELYSVVLGDHAVSEFEDFDNKDFPDHQKEIQVLYNVIDEMIGRGAKKHYFKFEGSFSAIPFVDDELKEANPNDYGIRLYCIRIDDSKLILLNGGVKTQRDPKQCPNVKGHFERGKRIAKVLDQAIAQKEIDITDAHSLNGLILEI